MNLSKLVKALLLALAAAVVSKKLKPKAKNRIEEMARPDSSTPRRIKATGTDHQGLLDSSSPKSPLSVALPEILRLCLEPGEEIFWEVKSPLRFSLLLRL